MRFKDYDEKSQLETLGRKQDTPSVKNLIEFDHKQTPKFMSDLNCAIFEQYLRKLDQMKHTVFDLNFGFNF